MIVMKFMSVDESLMPCVDWLLKEMKAV